MTMSLRREKSDTDEPTEAVVSGTTLDVIARARAGDPGAARVLLERTVGPLKRWARGRLPNYARAGANTEDIVQDVIVRALRQIDRFEHRTVDGLRAYLRESVRNRIRDEIRRVSRRNNVPDDEPETVASDAPSPLEQLILRERSDNYVAALRTLKPEERLAVIYRLEHGWSHQAIADKLGKTTPDAARMTVTRSMKRLAQAMGIAWHS
jgi:RNA polymerase sigma-70 factor (ECF subfamily)